MKNSLKLTLAMVAAFVIGFSFNNMAISDTNTKIAVVDVQKVVESSAKVKELRKEQQAKAKEMVTFIEKARKDVASTTDTKKKQALEEKYNKELTNKKAAIEKDYAQKLANIETNISNEIANIAKQNNYDIVLTKGIVLYGGEDITEAVKKSVK